MIYIYQVYDLVSDYVYIAFLAHNLIFPAAFLKFIWPYGVHRRNVLI